MTRRRLPSFDDAFVWAGTFGGFGLLFFVLACYSLVAYTLGFGWTMLFAIAAGFWYGGYRLARRSYRRTLRKREEARRHNFLVWILASLSPVPEYIAPDDWERGAQLALTRGEVPYGHALGAIEAALGIAVDSPLFPIPHSCYNQ